MRVYLPLVYFIMSLLLFTAGIAWAGVSQLPMAYWFYYGSLGCGLVVVSNLIVYKPQHIITLGLINALSCWIVGVSAVYPALCYGLVFIWVFSAIYFLSNREDLLFAIIFTLSLTILAALQPVSLYLNSERSSLLLVSALLVALLQLAFMPHTAPRKFQFILTKVILSLKQLYEQLFICLLAYDYPENMYGYERRLHIKKTQYLHYMRYLKEINVSLRNSPLQIKYTAIINKTDHLFDIFQDNGQLRYRIKDHATFQLCSQELIRLDQAIKQCLVELTMLLDRTPQQAPAAVAQPLHYPIQALEESYQHVLKSSASDPLSFLLFISSLKLLTDYLNELQQLLPLTKKG